MNKTQQEIFRPEVKLPKIEGTKISRRRVIQLGLVAALWAKVRKIPVVEAATKSSEKVSQSLSRKEYFKPFGEGKAEWQYVTFQYDNDKNERFGITVSMSELTDPDTGDKKHQLLVMRHNLQTKETQKRIYTGVRLFDENTSTYAFMDGDNQLAEFSYNEGDDKYRIQVHTDEFDSNEINSGGLVLNPQGDLIPVSKDGNFTVASFEGGSIDTNYFADHIRVETPEGEILGYGRRDSENLVLKGSLPLQSIDIDHTWVHVSGVLGDGKRVYITAWKSKTGGDYKFADVMVVNPDTGVAKKVFQWNEGDSGFNLNFESTRQEQEILPDQKYQMAHGGRVVATLKGDSLFELQIDGDPGQIIEGKGMFNMVEAHGRLVSAFVLGVPVRGDTAVWETSEERYSIFLPLLAK